MSAFDDARRDTHGPTLQGCHKAAQANANGFGFEGTQLVPISGPLYSGGVLDLETREGVTIAETLLAIAGPDNIQNTAEAVATRLDAFTRQVVPSYQIPEHRKRSKQTESLAAGQVFKNLGIDRILTGRSKPKELREKLSRSHTERWREKKNAQAATPERGNEKTTDTNGDQSNGGGEL